MTAPRDPIEAPATDRLRGLLHEVVCAIELGVLTHVDGSNESPHDGEHPHPWPCERMADEFRAKNLHLTAANWRGDGPHAFFLDPETGDEYPFDVAAARGEGRQEAVRLLTPWIRHETHPACNLTMMPETLKPDRHVCTCGLDRILNDLARHGRSSDPEPAPRYPIRFAGDGGPDTDDWTCSCGLTRPVTGSYGCADCGDGRPDSWERVGAVPALQATGEGEPN